MWMDLENITLSEIQSDVCVCVLSSFSRVQLFVTIWTVAWQAPLSMGILQARILEWVVMPSSRAFYQPRDKIRIFWGSWIAGRCFTAEPLGKSIMSDRKRQILYDITYMWSLQNNTSGSTQNRNWLTDIENRLPVTKRERYGERARLGVWD